MARPPYVCRYCDGTGRCPYCDGAGVITVPDDEARPCTSCAGTTHCRRCAGAGYAQPHAWTGPAGVRTRHPSTSPIE